MRLWQTELSLTQRAWIIVLVPAVVGILFTVMLGFLCLEIEKTVREQARIAKKLELVRFLMQNIGWQTEEYVAWFNSKEKVHFDEMARRTQMIEKQVRKLKLMSTDDRVSFKNLSKSEEMAHRANQLLKKPGVSVDEMKNMANTAVAAPRYIQVARDRMYERVMKYDRETKQKADAALKFVILGFLLNLFVSIFLLARFSDYVRTRLSFLKNSAANLAANQTLSARLPGRDELNLLEEKLVELSQELERARQRKQEFLSMIGHDLRSPITALQVTLEMFADGVYGKVDEETASSLHAQLKNIRQLVTFISDLLELEKIDAGALTLNLSKIEINNIIGTVADKVSQTVPEWTEKLETAMADEPIMIYCDPDRMEMALDRIVRACLADTPGPVKLKVADYGDRARARVTIETRLGHFRRFAPQAAFDRFSIRSDSPALFEPYRHSLALANQLLNLQHAEVDVSAQPNAVRFTITMRRTALTAEGAS